MTGTQIFAFLASSRFWLAGPVTVLVSLFFMLAMAVWVPAGAGQVNNIVMPLIMFPLIWSVLFFYTYLTQKLKQAWCVVGSIGMLNIAIIAWQFLH